MNENLHCYNCRADVSSNDHTQHMEILDRLWAQEFAGVDNLLVHSRPAEDERDYDGMTVQCDRHFIEELDTNLPRVPH